jgi:hypothetical protein
LGLGFFSSKNNPGEAMSDKVPNYRPACGRQNSAGLARPIKILKNVEPAPWPALLKEQPRAAAALHCQPVKISSNNIQWLHPEEVPVDHLAQSGFISQPGQ